MDSYTVTRQTRLKALAAIVVLGVLIFGVYYKNTQKNITLQTEDGINEYKSHAHTVEDFLEKEEITLKKNGYINYALDTQLEDNMYIVIKDPKRYTIELGSEIQKGMISPYDTVENVLKDLDIKLGSMDYTEPALDEKLKSGDLIKVYRVKEVVKEIEHEIPFEKVVNDNKELDKGTSKVAQKGQLGLKTEKIKEKYINDELVSSEIIEEEIVSEPVKEIVEKGTRQLVATSRGKSHSKDSQNKNLNKKESNTGDKNNHRKSIVMNASAYDLSFESTGKRPGDKGYGKTASGTQVRPGTVAVDPKVIPLGTRLYVESLDGTPDYGYCTAEDTGGAIKGNKIDLYFPDREQVRKFGRRNVKVYILD